MELSNSLVDFLKQPDSYPHRPETVKHIQTHISHVFIVPPYVYKLKKPVNLDFLDFSTPEKRRFFCRQEVDLNRRLCRHTYLGVVPITSRNGSYSLDKVPVEPEQVEETESTDPDTETVDYAVKMNQMEKENFLIGIIKSGRLNDHHMEQVAEKLAAFYNRQKPGNDIQKYGLPKNIRVNTDENFRQTRDYVGRLIEDNSYTAIRYYTNRFLQRNEPLFKRRMHQKRIIDGHGDLHLEHIHIHDKGICIYDCIEFNRRFRLLDSAADLAFLAMDMDFNQLHNESRDFIIRMSGKLNDPDLMSIIDFYKCYRAYIRGKVKSIESSDENISGEGRRLAEEQASDYFDLALFYALNGSEARIFIVTGRIASGKSTLAGHMAEKLKIPHYSTDIIRKKLAGISPTTHLPDSERGQLYSPEISERTYQTLLDYGIQEIRKGRSVILDGTFSDRDVREKWIEHFNKHRADYLFIEADAEYTVRRKRLRDRIQRTDVISDARIGELEMLDKRYRDPDHIKNSHIIRVDTTPPLKQTVANLFRHLVERHLSISGMTYRN